MRITSYHRHFLSPWAAIIFAMLGGFIGRASAASLPSGTVAYYSFDDALSLGADDSGNLNDLQGTAGTPLATNGVFNGALYLDGSTTLGTVSGTFPQGVPTGANPYTVAFFTKAGAGCASGGWIGYGTANAPNLANNFRLNGFSGVWNYWYAHDVGATLPSGSFQDGWHSVVGTWDGTTRKIYLDGVLQTTDSSGAPNFGSDQFVIGKTLNDCNFTGWLDELLIVNRAFTAQEAAGYHQYGAFGAPALPAQPSGLTAYAGNGRVFLTWGDVGGATGYNVKRSQTDGGPYALLATTAKPRYSDTAVNNGTTYYYVVSATNAVGQGTDSAQASALPASRVIPLLPSGVVAYYPFDGSAYDYSGLNNDLREAAGTAQFDPSGMFGDALYLDGHTTLGTVTSLFPTGLPSGGSPYTVAFFTKADVTGCANGGWLGYGTAGSRNLADNFRMNGFSGIQNYWYANDINVTLPGGATFQDGWHSVVGTWDGVTRKIYFDGALAGTDSPGLPSFGTAQFVVGQTLNDCTFTGWLDELVLANRAFSADEITAFHAYGAVVQPPQIPTSLVATPGNLSVILSWTGAPGAAGYEVERSSSDGGPYTVVGTTSEAQFLDNAVVNGQTYYYVIAATNNAGQSGLSDQASATPAYSPYPPGTVAYYSFDDPNYLGQDGGPNFNDLQGTAGTPAGTNGLFAGALFLDGATTLGTIFGTFPLGVPVGNAPYTVAFFTKAGSNGCVNGGWIGYGTPNTPTAANNFRLSGFGGVANYWYAADISAALPSGNFLDGWHSVVGTWDGATRRLYLDGVLRDSDGPTQPNFTADQFVIGKTLNDCFFTGSLDELVIADRALLPGEVVAYNTFGASGTPVLPSAPAGLAADPDNARVFLSWSGALGATAYVVKRSQTDHGPYQAIGSATGTYFVDAAVNNGTTYYYVVASSNIVGQVNSAQASAKPAAPALPTGVVAYYTFDGSGADDSGNGNNLQAATGAPQYIGGGKFGGALYLDGGTTLGTVSGHFPIGVPSGAAPYTVAFYTKADVGGSGNGGWIGYGTANSPNLANNFRMNGFGGIQNYWYANDINVLLPNASFQDGWHSVVGTWDGTTRKIYLDGLEDGSDTPVGLNIGTNSFVVGRTLNDANFKGWIDELLIANRAFTLEEVASYHLNGGAVGTIAPPTAPTGIAALAGNAQVYVDWEPVVGADSYTVQRSQTSGGPYTHIATVTDSFYLDDAADNGKTYYYVVAGNNSAGQGGSSAEVSATPVFVSLPAGTVVHYSFDDANNIGADTSGNSQDLQGTAGAPQYDANGRFGGALYLDGSTTLGTVSGTFPAGVPTGGNPYTVALFAKAASGGCGNGGWVGYGTPNTPNLANNFRLNGFGGIWNYWYANDTGAGLPHGNFQDGWHAVVGTWDGTTRKLYLDGELLSQDNPTGLNVGTSSFIVGKTLNDCNFTGWMDELLIANRAFTAGEAAAFSLGVFAPGTSQPGPARISAVNHASGDVTVTFSTAAGFSYFLQYKNSLQDATWTDVGAAQPGTGTAISITDPGAMAPGPGKSHRFYRVQLSP